MKTATVKTKKKMEKAANNLFINSPLAVSYYTGMDDVVCRLQSSAQYTFRYRKVRLFEKLQRL